MAERRFFGGRAVTDPEQALLEEMQHTAGIVRWLRSIIQSWPTHNPADTDGASAIDLSVQASRDKRDVAESGECLRSAVDERTGLPQLVGVHSTSRAIGFTDTEYAAWLKLFQREREHLVRIAKACIDANVVEGRQRALEDRAGMMRDVFGEVLAILGIEAPEAVITTAVRDASVRVASRLGRQLPTRNVEG